jgi:hypothetical protein
LRYVAIRTACYVAADTARIAQALGVDCLPRTEAALRSALRERTRRPHLLRIGGSDVV